ncbi:MAG: aldo/keto reductase [Candidatus Bathyarchaeota archaeon]|nr:aldo/keto reductase [Candidatus Bathyarchaeota archaeon]
MQKRMFGRTGLQVSIVGFGGTWISQISVDEAKKVVRRAFELGINYFDTAKLDGDSEEKIGAALKDVRDECILATKTGSRTKRESLADIKYSLNRLKTDRLDLIQLHGIDDVKTLKKATSPSGSLETCKEARSEGLVDFIGISSHKPRVLVKAIETNEFDTVLVPLNIVTRQALEELIPLAKDLDIGVAVMKPLSAKTSNITTCLYTPPLSLLSDEPELKTLLGQDKISMVGNALRFVLAQDVSVVVPGLRSIEEVEVAAEVGEEYKGLTGDEEKRFRVRLDWNHCRDCGLCLPCPQNLDIAAVLRFQMLSVTYGLKNWAKKLYEGLEVGVDDCTKCGECEPKCPYKLPIIEMLQKAQIDLRR